MPENERLEKRNFDALVRHLAKTGSELYQLRQIVARQAENIKASADTLAATARTA